MLRRRAWSVGVSTAVPVQWPVGVVQMEWPCSRADVEMQGPLQYDAAVEATGSSEQHRRSIDALMM